LVIILLRERRWFWAPKVIGVRARFCGKERTTRQIGEMGNIRKSIVISNLEGGRGSALGLLGGGKISRGRHLPTRKKV